MAKLNFPIRDYGGELSNASIPVADAITNGNITVVFDALTDVVIGNLDKTTLEISAVKDLGPGGNATSVYAQRESKWLVRYHDNTNLDKHTLELPCPAMALRSTGSDFMNLAGTEGLAFKTAFDAHARAPKTGNAVTLDSCELVGRNL